MWYLRCALLTAVIALALVACGDSSDGQGRATPTVPLPPPSVEIAPFSFDLADGSLVEAEWGVLTVPENRARPDSNLIDIPFVRFPTAAPNPGVPVVVLSDGPGLTPSPLDTASLQRWFDLSRPLRQSADAIVVAQRGGGRSTPRLDCPGTPQPFAFDRPLDFETEVVTRVTHAQACLRFWDVQGVDVSGYDAREMAADVDALRQSLGYEKISLWGVGFGLHQALAVLKYHSQHVERVALSQVQGPNHAFPLPAGYQRTLEELDARLADDLELRQQIPNLVELLTTVLGRLGAEPVTVEVPDPSTGDPVAVTVGAFDLSRTIVDGMSSTAFLATLPARLLEMDQADFTWLGEQALALRTRPLFGLTGILRIVPDCASGLSGERRARIDQQANETLLGAATNVDVLVCERLGVANLDLGAGFRADVQSEVPVLLISGSLDPVTPPANAEQVLAGLPNGQHLVIDGASADLTLALGAEAAVRFFLAEPMPPPPANPFSFEPLPPAQ